MTTEKNNFDFVELIIDDIIRREGTAYTKHPSDRGGATKYGITQRAWEDYWIGQWEDWRRHYIEGDFELPGEVRDITEQHARAFYREKHVIPFMWITHKGLCDLAVDSSVNHGRPLTIRWLQSAAGVTVDGIVGPITTQAVNARPNTCYKSLLVRRLMCYANLASSDEKQAVFLRGWINRVCEFVR